MSYTLYIVTKIFCKRAWFVALMAVGVLVLGPLSLLELIRLIEGNVGDGPFEPFNFHFAFLAVSWLLFISVCLHVLQDSQKIIFGLPVSSASIASALMFATVGVVVLMNLVTNGLYRITFFDENWLNDYWPLLGPTLFLATLVMVGHCIYWNLHAISFGRVFFWVGFVIAMFAWFLLRYHPQGFGKQTTPWSHVTLSELVTMQVVCFGAWYAGTRSFSNVRRGTAVPSLQWKRMEGWWKQLSTGSLISEKSAAISKSSALARLHWRDSCYVTLVMAVGLGAFGLVGNLVVFSYMATFEFQNHSLNENPIAVTTMCSFLTAIIVLLVLGQGLTSKAMTEMKRYLAMAPLSDQDYSAVILRNLIKCTALSILLVVLISLFLSNFIAALCYGFDNIKNIWGSYFGQDPEKLFTICSCLLIAYWAGIANCISVIWTGRKTVCVTVFSVIMGTFFCSVIGFNIIPESWQPLVEQGILLFLACCILIATVSAFYLARRNALLNSTTVWMAFLFTAFVPMLFWNLWNTDQAVVRIFLSSALILAITPFATIPLALSWNRHR